ncbi:cytochrome c biogenesis protein ResB [Amnibacterium endophyticum]|uniref:Cytochrome c biogenesis protein ResB n=1 Tax=Amnibacterium endophyticum TaxID=2109337 RepID=A0ABW4LCG9_9MICO
MSRPSDGRDEFVVVADQVVHPALGPVEWLRWAWRQLTSMRTALLLLLALAVAAVPGSLLPQQSADPNGVIAWRRANPAFVGVVDFLQGFTVYTSVWFSAIYILLFISLIGCVVPRLGHHLRALRAAPPRTPSRFGRLPASSAVVLPGVAAEDAVDAAQRLLRRGRYRTARYGTSVSAERGYLRESGNLLFHGALVGVLVTVFIGGGFTWTAQRVVVTGETFTNSQNDYDSVTPGRFFSPGSMRPYALTLDRLDVTYEKQNPNALGQPIDYTAHVTTRMCTTCAPEQHVIKVNQPLDIGGTSVYLLGNGYAPDVTIRDADGEVLQSGPVPFQPGGDPGLTSSGVIKVLNTPDQKRQIGFQGFLYPTAAELTDGTFKSIYPSVGTQSLLSLFAWEGAIDNGAGVPQNVYELDPTGLTQIAGRTDPVQLAIGQTRTLPDGLGSITLNGIDRYAALDVHHDPSQGLVALFVGLAVLGLITSLLVPRRRMWVKVSEQEDGLLVEYAGLARGDDPGLERAVADLQREHRGLLEPGAARPAPATR